MLCCGIKPLCGWNAEEAASVCRERCGGQGYLSCNKFGAIIGFAHAGGWMVGSCIAGLRCLHIYPACKRRACFCGDWEVSTKSHPCPASPHAGRHHSNGDSLVLLHV
jgi:hypothetical protein